LTVEALRGALLATDPPLVGRVEDDALCLDPRTLDAGEHPLVLSALRQALGDISNEPGQGPLLEFDCDQEDA